MNDSRDGYIFWLEWPMRIKYGLNICFIITSKQSNLMRVIVIGVFKLSNEHLLIKFDPNGSFSV